MKAFPKITKQEMPIFYEGKFAGYENGQDGMDLRDYFAAKAMQAMIAQCSGDDFDDFVIAHSAYQMADFMIKERDGEGFYAK